MSTSDPKPNVIVCAATKSTVGHVIPGIRHGCSVMTKIAMGMDTNMHGKQGFIDRHGNFHDRQAAWRIAEAAGQIKYRCGGDERDGGTLYSENLY